MIQQEWCTQKKNVLTFNKEIKNNLNIRPIGEEVKEGDRTFLKYEVSSVNQCHNDLYDDNKFTGIFFLNEDYRGGELKLYTWSKDTCTFPVELKPKTNSMVIFPSFIYHSVNDVKDGTRYVYTKFLK